jgi:hypothetical protein
MLVAHAVEILSIKTSEGGESFEIFGEIKFSPASRLASRTDWRTQALTDGGKPAAKPVSYRKSKRGRK